MNRDRQLLLLLRIWSLIDLLALFAVIMPQRWMAVAHIWLGMGELPEAPVVGYLARTVALIYAVHGALVLFLSTDLPRYRPVIVFLAWAALVSGVVVLAIDVRMEMPMFWIAIEGPTYLVLATTVLMLSRRSRQ